MTKNYKHIILLLWYSLLCASTPLSLKATPTHASIENDLRVPGEFISISKDFSKTKKYDTTNNLKLLTKSGQTANRSLSGAEANPLMVRWQKVKGPIVTVSA